MFNCALSKTRLIVLAILPAAALISVAIAVGLSVGLTRNKTKAHPTTGESLPKRLHKDI